jgi:hypothetical protein
VAFLNNGETADDWNRPEPVRSLISYIALLIRESQVPRLYRQRKQVSCASYGIVCDSSHVGSLYVCAVYVWCMGCVWHGMCTLEVGLKCLCGMWDGSRVVE